MRQIWQATVTSFMVLFSTNIALAQVSNANDRTPDAGNPAVELTPPGAIPPMSGNGIPPLGIGYTGTPPNVSPPSGRHFQSAPGFLPRPRDTINRPAGEVPANQTLPNGIVVSLPPAATGRQGLPPQTWLLLTAQQQELHRSAETAALGAQLGEGFRWNDSDRTGEVRVMADRIFNNRPCRDLAHSITLNGQTVTGQTTQCQ